MTDLPGYENFIRIEPLNKGWSEDKKYCVAKADGTKYMLRISPAECYEKRKALFEILKRVAALGIPMCVPIEFGTCDDGVYTLYSWIEGEDAETALPMLPETEQYVLGLQSGEILCKIHTLPAPENIKGWSLRYFNVMDERLAAFRNCGVHFDCDNNILNYLNQNRYLLENRPQCFSHGDYSIRNILITDSNKPAIVDWETNDFDSFGDPWLDFTDIVWGADISPHFASGQIRGYFKGKPPNEFWDLLMFYVFTGSITSIQLAKRFRQNEVENEIRLCKEALAWYDNKQNSVPSWYLRNFYIQYIDSVPYKLKAPFNFDFLKQYGRVFKVFDGQDSGNLCFGVQNGDNKYFVKFAGAPTEQYSGTSEDAIARLKATIPVYQDLVHPNLIHFIKTEEISGGYAAVFDWAEAECVGRQYPLSRRKFMQTPLEMRVQVFEDILAFHAYVAARGYVAIDFYEGSIMYDFINNKTVLCDIDFYTKAPYTNQMGRLWGSSRFMSPEEFRTGAVIDEITNVYTMGATAFALFSDYDRSPEKWSLEEKLYSVVKKAVSDERESRQQSIRQLIEEWEAAK